MPQPCSCLALGRDTSILLSDTFPLSTLCACCFASGTPEVTVPRPCGCLSSCPPRHPHVPWLWTPPVHRVPGVATVQSHALYNFATSVLLPSARKAAEMLSSPKGHPGCSGLLQSQALCEDKVFSFQEPCSLIAAIEQTCISLARSGE